MADRLYVIYDERANALDGTDHASVLESTERWRDVLRSDFDGTHGPMGIVWGYDVDVRNGKNELINERFVGSVADVKAGKACDART